MLYIQIRKDPGSMTHGYRLPLTFKKLIKGMINFVIMTIMLSLDHTVYLIF
jgi:hypothetical protein